MDRPGNAGRPATLPCSFAALAFAAGLAVVVAGCALPARVTSGKNWKIAPNFRVTHAGPGADQGYMALARQYEGERRWHEARDAWRKAALEAPNDADILNALGMAEASQGLYAASVAALRRAVAVAPDRIALRNNLGYALLLDGRDDEARTVLQDALERDPEHRLARVNLDHIDMVASAAAASTGKSPENAVVDPGSLRATVAGSVQTTANVVALQLRQTGSAVAQQAPVLATGDAAGEPVAPRAHVSADPRIEIANGNGHVGMAGRLRDWLGRRGVTGHIVLKNALPYNTVTTVVRYRAGFASTAQVVADGMSQPIAIAPAPELSPAPGGALDADVRVVLGRDQLLNPMARAGN